MMQLYFLATFLSAFLLFQVQPLIGKSILPWFGGAPAVWTTCMLFFQITLLAGYFYAYLVTRYLQGYLHGALLLISLLLLPIIPSIAWKPTDGNDPTILILILLLTTVGGPYLLLSATAPLLQSWFYETYQKPPFRLYALSNGASLIALFTYPLLIEPFLGSTAQALVWSCGYILFAVICSLLAFFSKIKPVKRVQLPLPSYKAIILWLLLSATGSIVLLATTNQLCLDIAPVPFLWVLPLSLYLLSFVICFDAASWYRRSWFNVLLVIMILCNIIYIGQMIHFHFIQIILLLSLSLFISCMTCHGELVRLKPDPKYLSLFYLMIALGGALGGIFVTIISPMIFVQFDEYSIGLILTSLLALITIRYERGASLGKFTWVFASFVCFFLLLLNGYNEKTSSDGVLDRKRNFYGTLRIVRKDSADAEKDHIAMSHGTTIHGYQFQKNELKRTPTAYYSKDSGIGLALTHHPKGNHLRVGVVGLGCGTLSAYMEKGDYIAFYEINQNVLVYLGNISLLKKTLFFGELR